MFHYFYRQLPDSYGPMSQLWKNLRITTKFSAGFGLFLVLLMMVALTGYLALRSVRSAEKTIQSSTEIEMVVIEMENAMEKAHRLNGDFFLHYPLIGFTRAQNLYARQSARQIAAVLENSTRLQEIFDNANFRAAWKNNHVDLNLYIASAKRFSETSSQSVELIKELADPVDGLEIQFENATVSAQNEATALASLKELVERMTSSSKDYLITRQRHFMQASFNDLALLQNEVASDAAIRNGQRRKLLETLSQWKTIAEKIIDVDVKIRSIINDFSLQTEATDSAAATLIKQAKEDVEHAQQRISQAHAFAAGIMAVITFTGLALAAVIARLLNNSITKNIVGLTCSAREFQQGNLQVTAGPEENPDEIGDLARSFNAMAVRIRGLVDTLEQKVEERTAELAESEKRFRSIIENTPQGILITEKENQRFLYANPSIARMLGYDNPLELIGKKITDIHLQQDWDTIRKITPETRFL